MEIVIGVGIGVLAVALFFAIRVAVLGRRSAPQPYLPPPPQQPVPPPPPGAVAGTPMAVATSLFANVADDLAEIAERGGGNVEFTQTEQVIVGPDGTRYSSIEEIADPELRARAQEALDKLGRMRWPGQPEQ